MKPFCAQPRFPSASPGDPKILRTRSRSAPWKSLFLDPHWHRLSNLQLGNRRLGTVQGHLQTVKLLRKAARLNGHPKPDRGLRPMHRTRRFKEPPAHLTNPFHHPTAFLLHEHAVLSG